MDWAGKFVYAFPSVGFIPQVLEKSNSLKGMPPPTDISVLTNQNLVFGLASKITTPSCTTTSGVVLTETANSARFHQNLEILNLQAWWL
jgi:hypothetical protein